MSRTPYYSSVSSNPAISAARGARCCHRMCSWLACAPAPGQPRPSSVGTPIAAVKLPSDPPPRCWRGNAIPTVSAMPRALSYSARMPGVLGVRRTVHAALHHHAAPRRQCRALQQRALHVHAVLDRVHPQIDLASGIRRDHVGPRPAPHRRGVQRDAAIEVHHAVHPHDLPRELHHRRCALLERAAGMRAAAFHAHDEPPDALARGDAGAALAGGFRDQHAGRLRRPRARSIRARSGCRPPRPASAAARSAGASSPSGAGSSAPRGRRGSCPPSCRRCPAHAPSRRSPDTACRPACRATTPCRGGPPPAPACPRPGCARSGCRRSRRGRGCG